MEELRNDSLEEVKEEERCVISKRSWIEDSEQITIRLPAKKIRVMSTIAEQTGRSTEEIAQMFLLFGYNRMKVE